MGEVFILCSLITVPKLKGRIEGMRATEQVKKTYSAKAQAGLLTRFSRIFKAPAS
jgi:hypothetical protein